MTSGKQGKKKRNNQKKSIPSPSSEIPHSDSKIAENNGKSDGEKCAIEKLDLKVESLQEAVEQIRQNQKDLKNQQKLNEDIRENQLKLILENIEHQQQKMLEKFEHLDEANIQKTVEDIREKQKLILEKLDKTEKEESETEEKPSFNSVISPGSLMKNAPSTGTPSIGRSFVLNHCFYKVSKFDEEKHYYRENEDHFGASWSIIALKKYQHFQIFLRCKKLLDEGRWAIKAKATFRLMGKNEEMTEETCIFGNVDENRLFEATETWKLIAWDELKENWLVDDKLAVEARVEILEMSGVYKENLRCFDETRRNFSDVVLRVKNQKFYVLKLFLASHSPYFESLFLEPYLESNKSEIELSGISPEDFQNYLEVLYGDPSIDESTVEGILLVADMYDTSIVIGKCEDFLNEKSEKSMKKKLQMAIRYNLDKLKNKCLSEIKTKDDLNAAIPANPEELDQSILAELYKKSLSFQ